jgi:hypothetical protein
MQFALIDISLTPMTPDRMRIRYFN